jgi:hypothetical protein
MAKNTIIFGAIAGLVDNIPKTIVTWGLYLSGYVNYIAII